MSEPTQDSREPTVQSCAGCAANLPRCPGCADVEFGPFLCGHCDGTGHVTEAALADFIALEAEAA